MKGLSESTLSDHLQETTDKLLDAVGNETVANKRQTLEEEYVDAVAYSFDQI